MIEAATTSERRRTRATGEVAGRPALTVIEGGRHAQRTRVTVAVAMLVCLLLTLAWSRVAAVADAERPLVAGTATVGPGQTLWDVALTHAPAGSDPRGYLQRLRAVNLLAPGEVAPWTVVLLPAE
ncbi:MAG: hypothetical protein M3N57_05830 [Actinomycetota bacterium]|nr:hypothetical protein [Actinomycetota bacterium]